MTKEEAKKLMDDYILKEVRALGELKRSFDRIQEDWDLENQDYLLMGIHAECHYRNDLLRVNGLKMSESEDEIWKKLKEIA